MNTLTPFIRHEMENFPGKPGQLGPSSSRVSPPLGREPQIEPPSQPDNPGVQLPPPEVPGQTPHPGADSVPQSGIPMTDGTPAPSRQKNAADFLDGTSPGLMAFYQPENNVVDARGVPPRRARPTQEDQETVLRLVEWREEATY
ncbi:MAG: hypothetical protein ACI4LE_01585 [Faecalibacterium sp.]